jgi:hypothetical protein
MVWTLAGGKVKSFRAWVDTAVIAALHRRNTAGAAG